MQSGRHNAVRPIPLNRGRSAKSPGKLFCEEWGSMRRRAIWLGGFVRCRALREPKSVSAAAEALKGPLMNQCQQ